MTARPAADPPAPASANAAWCSSAELSSCCAPEAKDSCCGTAAPPATEATVRGEASPSIVQPACGCR
ncbi:hypothetical protein [Actinocorallia longicatena]|uniref:hypothetical protein n=1 Tax=Actinocorallia longicatena TaxID=111803 RepID=UPI0031DD2BA6